MSDNTEKQVQKAAETLPRREWLRLASLAASYATASSLARAETAPGAQESRARPSAQRASVMRPNPAVMSRLVPQGVMTAAPRLTAAQQEVVQHLAHQARHEIVVAAASSSTRFAPRTMGAAVQRHLRRMETSAQTRTRSQAASLLRAPLVQQQDLFGRFAGHGAVVAPQAAGTADRTLASKLHTAFDERLAEEAGRVPQLPLNSRTTADIVLSPDLNQYARHIELDRPQSLTFRWHTEEPGATHAVWNIKYPDGVRQPVGTSGTAGQAPGGQFHVDLGRFLPGSPSSTPRTYYVQVQPMKGGGRSGQRAAGIPTPVGAPSNWIPIVYKKSSYVQPQLNLRENLGHYQRLELYVNKVDCVQETSEASSGDEILLGGFVTLSNGTVKPRAPWTVSTDFDQGETMPYPPSRRPVRWTSFKFFETQFPQGNILGREAVDSIHVPWPRLYSFGFVMGERDGGGFPAILQELVKALLDELAPYVEEILAGAVGAAIGAALGAAAGGPVGAAIGAVVGLIVGELVEWIFGLFRQLFDNPDDLLAERTYQLRLPSSKAEEIHKLPGTVSKLANGKTEFVGNSQVIRFEGGDDSGGGIYDVEVFWKATGRVFDA